MPPNSTPGHEGPERPSSPFSWPRFPIFALLALLLLLPFFLDGLFDGSSRADLRYDQFKDYVRQDRVAWVHLGAEHIEGGFQEGQSPESGSRRFVTGRVENDDSLLPLLEEHDVAVRAVRRSPWGEQLPWLLFLFLPLVVLFFLFRAASKNARSMASGAFALGKTRGRLFEANSVSVLFDDVAGVDEAKQELQEVVEFLREPERYRRVGARIPKGVLLLGPPGTGKTLLARAVAGEAGVPFISINGSEFVEMFVGVGAARVRDLFEQAAANAPCIVFIDELDALGRSRGGNMQIGTNEERESTLNQLLVELDGFEPKRAVILMAATNRPEVLDRALLRPGRFDRQVLVDRPDRRGRKAILDVHSRGVPLDPDVDLETIAARTPGFAGADLANLVNEAALMAGRARRDHVTMDDFSSAIDRVIAGLEKKSRIMSDEERKRVAYHEVGHALASTLAGADTRVHKISIVPRGLGALGYTMQLPTEDRYLMTETELRARLVGLMGGRAAEEVVFGEASTGAQDDLQKATDIARAMVADYGLSRRVGPVTVYGSSTRSFRSFGSEIGPVSGPSLRDPMSDRLAEAVDEEIRRIIDDARKLARELLEQHRESLETLAEQLLGSEVLEGPELERHLEQARADARAHHRRRSAANAPDAA